jgi:uncharacterized membrane protein
MHTERDRGLAFAIAPETTVPTVIHLPSFVRLVRHAFPSLLEGSIGPAALFYVTLLLIGFKGALVVALVWSYAAAGRRLVLRQRIPALLVLGLGLLTARSVIAFLTNSAFLYFVQPTVGTLMVAILFLVTAVANRPFVERLAHDFCPIDEELMARPHVRRFFVRVSLLWSVVLLVNAGFVLWLLFASSLHAFLIERTLVTWALTGGGTALSILWFVRTMRTSGISVRFGGTPAPSIPSSAAQPLAAAEPLGVVGALAAGDPGQGG